MIPDESAKPLLYPISQHDSDCGYPDIVYHASSVLFIVVYTCHHSDVFVRTFSPTTETLGEYEVIASGGAIRGYPAIACNQTAGSCLVAFQHDHIRIKGAYVDVDCSVLRTLALFMICRMPQQPKERTWHGVTASAATWSLILNSTAQVKFSLGKPM